MEYVIGCDDRYDDVSTEEKEKLRKRELEAKEILETISKAPIASMSLDDLVFLIALKFYQNPGLCQTASIMQRGSLDRYIRDEDFSRLMEIARLRIPQENV